MAISQSFALFAAAVLICGAADEPPASPIRFNQWGMEAEGPKTFVVATDHAGAVPWSVRNAQGRTIHSGLALPTSSSGDGERTTRIVLDRGLPNGRYVLTASGIISRPFTVAKRPFRAPFQDAMSFFYQQRAGVPIERRYVQRPDLARPAGHAVEQVSCFAGIDLLGASWPGCSDRIDASGGWYDAGDRGKYVVNGAISVWALLDAYERAPNSDLMADGVLAMPEAGNDRSDLLDEARVELEWMLRMQIAAGIEVPVLAPDGRSVTLIAAGGLVYNKVADIAWSPVPIRVEDDQGMRALYPPTTAATLDFAAVTAQAARLWKTLDPGFAATCLAASRRAFAAAVINPGLIADDRFTGSGGYGDTDLADEWFWAAAELAATTGESAAIAAVQGSKYAAPPFAPPLAWNMVATAGTISLLRVTTRLPAALRSAQRHSLLASADMLLAQEKQQPYHIPFPTGPTPWGSNGALLDRGIILGTAYDLTHRNLYRMAVIDAADYVLGRNPLDRSYISGYGARPMRYPHHRWWGQGVDARFPGPPPGVLSGGPNSMTMTDTVALAMRGTCGPQTCWRDDALAFTQNEVAINWNAPLVWISAFLDDTREIHR